MQYDGIIGINPCTTNMSDYSFLSALTVDDAKSPLRGQTIKTMEWVLEEPAPVAIDTLTRINRPLMGKLLINNGSVSDDYIKLGSDKATSEKRASSYE